jgi:probable HAF family extracellular repeat protein
MGSVDIYPMRLLYLAPIAPLLASPMCQAQVAYSVLEIPTQTALGRFYPTDLNDSGLIVGSINTTQVQLPWWNWVPRPATWTASTGHTLLPGVVYGEANAVNNAGQIAGTLYLGNNLRAARWDLDGTLLNLGVLAGSTSRGFGISSLGDVVGETYTPENMNRLSAFLYTNATGMINLGDGGRSAYATGANASGLVVGTRITGDPAPSDRGFAWTSAEGMFDIPLEPGLRTYAEAVNDRGQVTGTAQNQAYLWDPTIGMILLNPSGGGNGLDLNEAGTVVGICEHGPFVWNLTDGFRPLNSLIPTPIVADRVEAFAINDAGQILVSAAYWMPTTQYPRYYLLTPIPEPGVAIIVLQCFGVAAVRRRRSSASTRRDG